MCDPVTLTVASVGLTAAGTGANMYAQSKARKSQQATMDANLQQQRAQFDKRMGLATASDARTMDLTRRQYDEGAALEDKTFAYLLNQNQGLLTEQKKIQADRVADKAAEAQRQSGYAADVMGLLGSIGKLTGYDAQQAYAADSFGHRMAVADAALGSGEMGGFTPSADPLVQQAFTNAGASARADAGARAAALARVGSMDEAASFASQLQGDIGTRADITEGRADLSARMGQRDLSVRDLQDQLAVEAAQKRASAFTTWAGNQEGVLGQFFGSMLNSEAAYTQGMLNSSQNAEDKTTNLANYKIQNTQANTTFGDLLKLGGAAAGAFGSGLAASGATKGAALTTEAARLNSTFNNPSLVNSARYGVLG